jgi:hypothetical protein
MLQCGVVSVCNSILWNMIDSGLFGLRKCLPSSLDLSA